MFQNPRKGTQARNFTTNVPKIVDLKSSSGQIFFENWRWVFMFRNDEETGAEIYTAIVSGKQYRYWGRASQLLAIILHALIKSPRSLYDS